MAPKTKAAKTAPVPKHPILCKTSSGTLDHLALSESLGYHIFRKKQRRSWTPSEDKLLKAMVIQAFLDKHNLERYNKEDIDISEIDWVQISAGLDGRKSKECRKRWSSSLNPRLRKGKWTKEEDAQLVKAYKKYGSSWQKVATLIKGRNEDQCSKRYTEVLDTDPKERLKAWTEEEDLKLIHGVKKCGTKWRAISKSLKGRPSLTCRNRWRRIITDVAKGSANEDIMKAVGVLDKNGNRLYTFEASKKSKKSKKSKRLQNSTPVKVETGDRSTISAAPSPQFQQTASKKGNATGIAQSYSPSTSSSYASVSSPSSSTSSGSGVSMNILGHNTCPPTRSYTHWQYALLDPRTNEELTQFSGQISTASVAHKLIELAKYNGVTLTVHQHIHHHYSPASPVPDPQASVSRFSHFNYLPPLTEVPKLTSSSPGSVKESSTSPQDQQDKGISGDKRSVSSPNGVVPDALIQYQVRAGGNNSPSSLIPMLANRDRRSLVSGPQRPETFARSHSTENASQKMSQERSSVHRSNSVGNTLPRRQQLVKDSAEIRQDGSSRQQGDGNPISGRKGVPINANSTNSDDLEEEGLDFWETLRSITQPKPQSGGRPVSQHHPVHYLEAAETETYSEQKLMPASGEGSARNGETTESKRQMPVPNKFDGFPKNDAEEEEEEEMENYTNQYGMYYNVFPNKPHSGSKRSPHADSEFGYVMPFNPS